jgi:hypothetical protein
MYDIYTATEDGTKKKLTVKKMKTPSTFVGHNNDWQEEIKKIYFHNVSKLDLADTGACTTWIPGVTIRMKRAKLVRDYATFMCWEEGVQPSTDGAELAQRTRFYVLDVNSTDKSVEIAIADSPYEHLRLLSAQKKLTEDNALTGGFRFKDDAWLLETQVNEDGTEKKVTKTKLFALAKEVKAMKLSTLANNFAEWISTNGGASSTEPSPDTKVASQRESEKASVNAQASELPKKTTTTKKPSAIAEEVTPVQEDATAVAVDHEDTLRANYLKCQGIVVKFKELKSASEQLQSAEKSLKDTRLRLQNSKKSLKEVNRIDIISTSNVVFTGGRRL